MLNWETTTIGELLEFKNGLNKGKEFFGKGTPIVNYMDVYKHRGIHAEQLRGHVTLSTEEIRRFDVHKGDVFFTRTSETPEEVGYVGVMLDEIDDCVFSGFVLRGRPKTDKLDIGYCQYAFMTEEIRMAIMSGCTYTTRALTNGRQLSAIEILLPDKDEQRRIAEALTDTDALLAAMEKLIAKKRAIKQGAMQELLTGKRRLPGFEGAWATSTLGEYCTNLRKGQIITESARVEGNIPVVAGGKTAAYYHNAHNRDENTISISASGASAGFVAFWERKIFASDCSTIESSDKYNVQFVYYYLLNRQADIYAMQTGGAQPHVQPTDLAPMMIKVPQKAEQTAIASIFSDIDAEIDALTAKLSKLRSIKQGMMSELLTGRIRLVEQDATSITET